MVLKFQVGDLVAFKPSFSRVRIEFGIIVEINELDSKGTYEIMWFFKDKTTSRKNWWSVMSAHEEWQLVQ